MIRAVQNKSSVCLFIFISVSSRCRWLKKIVGKGQFFYLCCTSCFLLPVLRTSQLVLWGVCIYVRFRDTGMAIRRDFSCRECSRNNNPHSHFCGLNFTHLSDFRRVNRPILLILKCQNASPMTLYGGTPGQRQNISWNKKLLAAEEKSIFTTFEELSSSVL